MLAMNRILFYFIFLNRKIKFLLKLYLKKPFNETFDSIYIQIGLQREI